MRRMDKSRREDDAAGEAGAGRNAASRGRRRPGGPKGEGQVTEIKRQDRLAPRPRTLASDCIRPQGMAASKIQRKASAAVRGVLRDAGRTAWPPFAFQAMTNTAAMTSS